MANEYDDLGFVPSKPSAANYEDLGFVPSKVVVAPNPNPLAEQEAIANQYIAKRSANPIEQIINDSKMALGVIPAVGGLIYRGAGGAGELLGEGSVNPSTLAPNVAQTGIEAGGRVAFDLMNQGRQALQYARDEPLGALRAYGKLMFPANPLNYFMPSGTITPEETAKAVQRELANQAFAQVREAPIAGANLQGGTEGNFGEANLPLADAVPVVAPLAGQAPSIIRAGVRTLASPAQKVLARGFTTPTIEKAAGLLKGADEATVTETLSGALPRISEVSKTIPKTAKETVSAARKAQVAAIDETKTFLKNAEDGGYTMNGNPMIDSGRQAILKNFESYVDKPQVVEEILSKFSQLNGDVSPVRGQKFLLELNNKYNSLVDKASPEAFAYRAIRNELSGQLDDIVKLSSGKNIQPYRDWGHLEEFANGIEGRLKEAFQAAGREAVPITSESALGGASTLRGQIIGAVARRSAKMMRPLIKQGKEFVEEATQAVIKDSPKKVSRDALPQESISALQQKYLKAPPIPATAPVSTPVAAAAPAVDLEALIVQRIKELPAGMQGRPATRSIAIQTLQEEGLIP